MCITRMWYHYERAAAPRSRRSVMGRSHNGDGDLVEHAVQVSQKPGPGHTGKFQRHPCQSQAHKAQNHKYMHDPLSRRETLNVVSLVFLFGFSFLFEIFERTGHPKQCVEPKKAEYPDK